VLARALVAAGRPVAALHDLDPAAARALAAGLGGVAVTADAPAALAAADVVFLTVPDDAIAPLAASLGASPASGKIVFHTSGALTAAVLAPLAEAGAHPGTLHPLQTFADPGAGPERLAGVFWTGDGDARAMALAERLVADLGGRFLAVPAEGRALYHAAAVVASNYMVALADQAGRLMAAAGADPEEALAALLPLMRGTLENLARSGAGGALTGPVARGDAETVRRHLETLGAGRPEAAHLYRALGRACLELAASRGLDPERVAVLRRLLADPE
jgi:predicted short-subunit dehydrogenase-like oxidoreductase (DUF2520 family)